MIRGSFLYIVFLLVSHFSVAQSLTSSSDMLKVNYEAEEKSLSQVFKDLEKKYDIFFALSPQQLKGKKATIHSVDEPIESFLKRLLSQHRLTFEIIEDQFISIKKAGAVFIRAKIFDEDSNEGLPYAIARLKGTEKGYVADDEGNFRMIVDQPDSASLVFSFLGYEDFSFSISEYESGEVLNIPLSLQTEELEEVVIKEYINNGITTDETASRISVGPQELEILPGLVERDILLSAQILAGIGSNDESASGINVRGSSRDNTFIYWNNIPVYQAAHYFGNISAFIPSSIGKVDIYKNHIPVKYSGASAGLVLTESRGDLTPEPLFETSINLTHADAFASIPVNNKKGSLMLAARRSFNNIVATPTFNAISDKLFEGSFSQEVQEGVRDEDFDFSSKLVFSDLNLRWVYELSDQDQISLSGLRSESVLDFTSIDDEDINSSNQEYNVRNLGVNLSWEHRWSSRFSSDLSASLSDYKTFSSLELIREEEDEADNDARTNANELTNLEVRLGNQWRLAGNHLLSFGYQYNFLDVLFENIESNTFEEDIEEAILSEGGIHGFYADFSGRFLNRWSLNGGFRVNNYRTTGTVVVDPQIRVGYELTDHVLLKSSFGIYSQYLRAIQEAEFNFSNFQEQQWIIADSDEDLPLIRNQQLVVGLLFDKKGWLVDLDLYRKVTEGLLARNFGPSFDDTDAFLEGTEQILGIDFTLKKRWKFYRAWLSYSYQESLADLPALELFDFTSGLNVRHQLQISQTAQVGRFEFSLGYTIKSGLPFTNAANLEFIDNPEVGEEEGFEPFYEINFGPLNQNRLPVYQRLDLSVWHKFPSFFSPKIRGELGLSILNVLDRNNLFTRTFGVDQLENEAVSIFQNDKSLLGITPNLSLRLNF